MGRAHALAEAHGGRYAFASVYLAEAHASDEFPLGRHVEVRRHTTLDERRAAARGFAAAVGWRLPLYVDALDDAIADALRAHPERFYVLEPAADGRSVLRFAAPGRNGGVDIGDLEEFLLRHAP